MPVCTKCSGEKTGAHVAYCVACFNAYKRQWYQKNREKEIARCAAYNKAKPEVPASAMRRSRAKDPDKAREYLRQYRSNNPEKSAMWDAEKRAKRRAAISATIGKISPQQWSNIKQQYRNHCAYCLKPFERLTMDHIVPLARGGSHTVDNIVPSCQRCNSAKHANDQLDFVAKRFGRLI